MRFGGTRLNGDRPPEIFDCFFGLALLRTGDTHVQQRVEEIRPDLQRLLEMRPGLIVLALLTQDVSKVVLNGKVRWSHRQGVLKQADTVVPPTNLCVRKSSKNQQYQ